MKRNWQTLKLGDVCDFEGGSQPPKSEFIFEAKPNYVRFLQIRDFGSDKNITYIPEAKKNRKCVEDDILIGRYGATVGKILTNKSGAYNVALMKTIPDLALLDRTWFFNYLISDEFQSELLNVAERSAQAGFSKDDIYNFPVLVPPILEQQRIVAILDQAFEGIAKGRAIAEQNLQNACDLFESHLQSVFQNKSWKRISVEEACTDIFAGGDAPKEKFSLKKSEKFTIPIFANAVKDNGLYGYTNFARVTKPSVTISARGSGTGHTEIRFESFLPIVRLIVLIPNSSLINLEFLKYSIDNLEILRSGSAIPQLTVPMIKEYHIPLPTLPEQLEIISQLEILFAETQRLEAIYQRKIALLVELKKSLLQQAFAGEL